MFIKLCITNKVKINVLLKIVKKCWDVDYVDWLIKEYSTTNYFCALIVGLGFSAEIKISS